MPRLPALVSRCCRDPSSGQDWNAANWCNGGQRARLSSYGPCTLRVACPARRCVHSWTSCATSIRTVSSSCRGDQEPQEPGQVHLLHFRGEYWRGSEPDPVLACCCRLQNAIYLPTTAKLIAHRCHRNCPASPAVLTVAGSELHRAARFLIGAANTLRDAASSMTSAANSLRVVAAEA